MLHRRSFLIASLTLITMVSSFAFAAPKEKKSAKMGGASSEGPASLEGKDAPDFTFSTIDGKEVSLSSEKGNVVLLDYWATWCGPCVKGLPHINELANNSDYTAKGLKVWAVNSKETEEKVKPFLKKHNLTMTIPMDTKGEFGKSYLVRGIPTTVLVGRDGKVKKAWVGFGPNSAEEMKTAIAEALKDESPSKGT